MRILLVEDDKDLCTALEICLQKAGYRVDCVYNGEDGLQYGLQNAYDLILLDRMLPERDGLAVVAALRQAQIDVPVLMLTSLDGIQDRVQGLDAGADDYLTKPFATEELLARIRAIARRPGFVERPEEAPVAVTCAWTQRPFCCTGRGATASFPKKKRNFLHCFSAAPGRP